MGTELQYAVQERRYDKRVTKWDKLYKLADERDKKDDKTEKKHMSMPRKSPVNYGKYEKKKSQYRANAFFFLKNDKSKQTADRKEVYNNEDEIAAQITFMKNSAAFRIKINELIAEAEARTEKKNILREKQGKKKVQSLIRRGAKETGV